MLDVRVPREPQNHFVLLCHHFSPRCLDRQSPGPFMTRAGAIRVRAHRPLCPDRGECIIGPIGLQWGMRRAGSRHAWIVLDKAGTRSSMDWSFELVAGPYDGLVDAPVWDGEGLLFSLVEAGRIMRYVPGTGQVT